MSLPVGWRLTRRAVRVLPGALLALVCVWRLEPAGMVRLLQKPDDMPYSGFTACGKLTGWPLPPPKMMGENHEATYWGQTAKNLADGYRFDQLRAEQFRRVHMNLLEGWTDLNHSQRILKTDLFAEAMDPSRAFMWQILERDAAVVGIDISPDIAGTARVNARQYAAGPSLQCASCDVRRLPFAGGTFDLVVSDSTLDHFKSVDEIVTALAELARVLKPGGTLVITMDNKGNLTEPLFRMWIRLGLSRFFIGETYSMGELQRALSEAGLRVTDTTAILHNPRFFTRAAITLLQRVGGPRFDRLIGEALSAFDRLEDTRIRYLTAQFIAARAVKPLD